ncbi:MAG TPA: prolipoprotein diacylglyceryl transferase [Firmicutes bacterium]|nr:prolipoprotein diacylglyceryl transferase [Bacillota bacterium]
MFQVFIYVGVLVALGGFVMFLRSTDAFLKRDLKLIKPEQYKKILLVHLGWMALSSFGVGFALLGAMLDFEPALMAEPVLQATFGGFLALFFFEWIYSSFALYYFKKDLDEKYKPLLLVSVIFSILPLIVSLWVMSEGTVLITTFPLPKGIPFNDPIITFYALFILSGAVFVYFIADWRLQKDGYRKGYAENIFYVAFPAGILGARLWYVVGQWNTEFANRPFWKVFAMWEGGLAIMGGALFGAIAGILFIYFRRKDITIRHAADIGVPVILLAQGIGRWGNFFNQEVYGAIADVADWSFLPTFIQRQMTIDGQFRVPLFLIESIINITGYFVIRFAIGTGLKKYIVPGDLAMAYPIWYGITRVIMEPLRDPTYIMNNLWSYYWGMIFAGLGVLGIVALHLFHHFQNNKKTPIKPA